MDFQRPLTSFENYGTIGPLLGIWLGTIHAMGIVAAWWIAGRPAWAMNQYQSFMIFAMIDIVGGLIVGGIFSLMIFMLCSIFKRRPLLLPTARWLTLASIPIFLIFVMIEFFGKPQGFSNYFAPFGVLFFFGLFVAMASSVRTFDIPAKNTTLKDMMIFSIVILIAICLLTIAVKITPHFDPRLHDLQSEAAGKTVRNFQNLYKLRTGHYPKDLGELLDGDSSPAKNLKPNITFVFLSATQSGYTFYTTQKNGRKNFTFTND